ncbi:MAG: alpha-galactosidase, partial [Thermoguttaceae bacterium]|nr:alpha-galactosidase [Thermoguttaceae bacterium]
MTGIIATLILSLGAWTVSFNEPSALLTLEHPSTGIKIAGTLGFSANGETWRVAASRDGVKNRLALVDPRNEVQGYVVINADGGRIEALVYHRTRQFYAGNLEFRGEILFRDDSFPCRTRAAASERVLSLASGTADSTTFDSLFAREEDLALRFDAPNFIISTKKNAEVAKPATLVPGAQYDFVATLAIQEASQAVFAASVDEGYFQKRWVPYYAPINRERCPSPPTGWMSWNTYFDKATAEDNLAEARVGKEFLQPFGLEIWSIESWQGNSDQLPVSKFYNLNLETNETQFPKGMKQLADDVRALGFRPGLWTAPFGTGSEEFYNAHKDWFLHDEAGKPISCWNGRYTIDPSNDEVVEHLRKIHDVAAHDWGYEFFKIDGMSGSNSGYCAHMFERPEYRSRFKNPDVEAPFERCVRALREGIGEDRIFLACQGHFTGPEAAYADAAR